MQYKGKLLVVEDDLHLLEGIRDILQLEGYEVLTARDGEAGLSALRDAVPPPDLIVSDIMMPRMNGLELLDAVRQEERWVKIPFIFLTARGEREDIQRGKKKGVDDYLVKPFDASDLLIAIEAKLNRHRSLNRVHQDEMVGLKRSILTILNHEFRTPLTLIVAYADMLNEGDPNKLSDDELLTFLKGVNSGADRLRHLIENFILLVELQTGEAAKNLGFRQRRHENVAALVYEAHRRATRVLEIPRECQVHVEDDAGPVLVDSEYVIGAIEQLIDNALKFSPEDSTVFVQARLQPTANGSTVRISVQDHGRGIPDEELAHIWDYFYQINRSTFEDQGAGSGLAIVRGMAELHGGSVEVATTPGEGSVFTFVLPVA